MKSVLGYLRNHHLALVAIVLATGGTAYAAGKIGSAQIKDNAILSRHIKDGQVKPADLASTARGVKVIQVTGPTVTLAPSGPTAVGVSIATCPVGTEAVGGGWDGLDTPPTDATVSYNEPLKGAWEVLMSNNAPISATFAAEAKCVHIPGSSFKNGLRHSRSVAQAQANRAKAAADLRAVRAAR